MDAAGEQRVNSVLPRFELNNVVSRFQHISVMFGRNGVKRGRLPRMGNGIDGDVTVWSFIRLHDTADKVGRSRIGNWIRQSNQANLPSAILFSTFGTTTGFFVAVGLCREAVSAF
jgi:hypothetical protein